MHDIPLVTVCKPWYLKGIKRARERAQRKKDWKNKNERIKVERICFP